MADMIQPHAGGLRRVAAAAASQTAGSLGITQDSLPYHELVGLHMLVRSAPNPSVVGLNGTVVDETKHMIAVRTLRGRGEEKRIPKRGAMLEFSSYDAAGDASRRIGVVDGSRMLKRPFERRHASEGAAPAQVGRGAAALMAAPPAPTGSRGGRHDE